MNKLTIFVNQQVVFEYDRDTALDDRQLEFLDKMDGDMTRGIKISGELIPKPDLSQRARFVALNLVKALKQGNDAAVSVSCAYLAKRLPFLNEVHANDTDIGLDIKLIE